jgi:hypothetical protein
VIPETNGATHDYDLFNLFPRKVRIDTQEKRNVGESASGDKHEVRVIGQSEEELPESVDGTSLAYSLLHGLFRRGGKAFGATEAVEAVDVYGGQQTSDERTSGAGMDSKGSGCVKSDEGSGGVGSRVF